MKNLALVLFVALFGFAANAQEVSLTKGAKISFNKDVHDYGEMEQGGDPYCEFEFTNNGNEPLIISNAKGSCGCTVPEWPKTPVMPGKTEIMKVRYDTKRVGPINKSVTITSNAIDNPTMVLRIKGNIKSVPSVETPVKKVSEGAPVNK
jgi:hypothetical protein